jgi:hypothetical protein
MYTFTPEGVRVFCGACRMLTPVHTTVRIKVGSPPSFCRRETGRWDWANDAPETCLVKYARTRTVDACPACADRLARQRRTGGFDFLPEQAAPAPPPPQHAAVDRMPRLIKHRKEGTP